MNNVEEVVVDLLDPADIDDLICQTEIQRDGGYVGWVVDPAELQKFCFPIRPASLDRIDLDEIGTHQIGLYEVFYRNKVKPILAEEYVDEVRLILEWFLGNAKAAYSGLEMVDSLLQLASYDENSFRDLVAEKGVEEVVLEKGLRFFLSVALGIHSYAVERLTDIFRHRLDKTFPSNCGALVQELSASYEAQQDSLRIPLVSDVVFRAALRARKSRRHAEFDARVIDRLFFLNNRLEQAFRDGDLKERNVFLYVSSAPRSRAVFCNSEIREHLPVINDRQFSFWRHSVHLFTLAVRRGIRQDGSEDFGKTIENLRNLKTLLENIQGIGGVRGFKEHERCGSCWLANGRPLDCDCELATICEALSEFRESCEARRQTIEDAHLANKLASYSVIAKLMDSGREAKYGVFLDALRKIQDPRVGDSLVKRALEVQKVIALRGSFASDLPEGAKNIFDEQSFEDHDAVTSSSQFFPRRVRFKSAEHSEIWNAILRFFDVHARGEMRSKGTMPEEGGSREDALFAFSSFLQLESTWKATQNADHELTRCLLYLSFVTREHEEKAFEMAIANADRFLGDAKEFLCVAVYAGRRCGNFKKTDEVARRAIDRFPEDWRLYHACQLNVFSWLRAGGEDCSYSLLDCADLSEKTISGLLKEEPKDEQMLAVNFNNLAFVSAFDDGGDRSAFNLERARGALENLKTFLPKSKWKPLYPEYYHTEAHLELKEAESAFQAGDRNRVESKLRWGYQDAKIAAELFSDKDEHQKTLELIIAFAAEAGISL